MKVYELMNKLSEMPSGAEVRFGHIISTNNFNKMELLGKDGENEIRSLAVNITSVDYNGDDIYLHGETR